MSRRRCDVVARWPVSDGGTGSSSARRAWRPARTTSRVLPWPGRDIGPLTPAGQRRLRPAGPSSPQAGVAAAEGAPGPEVLDSSAPSATSASSRCARTRCQTCRVLERRHGDVHGPRQRCRGGASAWSTPATPRRRRRLPSECGGICACPRPPVMTMVARDDLPTVGGPRAACGRRSGIDSRDRVRGSGVGVWGRTPRCVPSRPAPRFKPQRETVARLQRAVRPSAGYARSLSVLARPRRPG